MEQKEVFNIKNGRKPTVSQRKFIESQGLNGADWLISKDTPEAMTLVHRDGGQTREISKEG